MKDWSKSDIQSVIYWFKKWGLHEERSNRDRNKICYSDIRNFISYRECYELKKRENRKLSVKTPEEWRDDAFSEAIEEREMPLFSDEFRWINMGITRVYRQMKHEDTIIGEYDKRS